MEKVWKFFSTYIIPVLVIGTVVVLCIMFLLDNLPYDNRALNVNISQERVIVDNKLLLSDELGKVIVKEHDKNGTLSYVDIDIESLVDGKVKYEVVLIKEDSLLEVDSRYVKLYVTDLNDNPLNSLKDSAVETFYDLRVSETDPSGKVLYSGYLKDKSSKKIRIRAWVADNYEITADAKMFSMKLKVNVK